MKIFILGAAFTASALVGAAAGWFVSGGMVSVSDEAEVDSCLVGEPVDPTTLWALADGYWVVVDAPDCGCPWEEDSGDGGDASRGGELVFL
ncbi:hypothetical protein [Nocardia terpenica]|uniref:Uncharacterized protein n=1 Tax=Nocardia terpenica TaxID=455432 RepID=A0A161XCU0_9NOCA|nr:hypothetical protein [Nocardia terpenica]KZM71078.1 hypothetical protein AWN90_41950 [Nocardia terpenica]NQE89596.1 hypothetical protein [Nocardia terpenica]